MMIHHQVWRFHYFKTKSYVSCCFYVANKCCQTAGKSQRSSIKLIWNAIATIWILANSRSLADVYLSKLPSTSRQTKWWLCRQGCFQRAKAASQNSTGVQIVPMFCGSSYFVRMFLGYPHVLSRVPSRVVATPWWLATPIDRVWLKITDTPQKNGWFSSSKIRYLQIHNKNVFIQNR